LDMKTKDIIKDALRDFDGTLILVSRQFPWRISDKGFWIRKQRVVEHFEDIGFLANKKMESERSRNVYKED
jgi:ATP-binding cassette subfamily F protein 3